jgi:hypothetical protein
MYLSFYFEMEENGEKVRERVNLAWNLKGMNLHFCGIMDRAMPAFAPL